MGRPMKDVNSEQLKKLAEKQWTVEEIAAFFCVSRKTIERRFGAIIEEARHVGRSKLRDILWARGVGDPERGIVGSDRILENLCNRYLGPVKQEIQNAHDGKIEVIVSDYRSSRQPSTLTVGARAFDPVRLGLRKENDAC